MAKTSNPNRLCKCGSEINTIAIWVECSCGILLHIKKKKNGRIQKPAYHEGKEAVTLKARLKARGVIVVIMRK